MSGKTLMVARMKTLEVVWTNRQKGTPNLGYYSDILRNFNFLSTRGARSRLQKIVNFQF